MNLLDAIHTVLNEATQPLGPSEILARIIAKKLWVPRGKTPKATVSSYLSHEVSQKGGSSRFQRVGRGRYVISKDRRQASIQQGRRASGEGARSRADPHVVPRRRRACSAPKFRRDDALSENH